MQMKNFRNSYHTYAVITILSWSLAYVFTKLALQYYSVYALGFLRYLIASVILLIIALKMKMPLPRKRDIPWFLAAGCAGFFLYMITFNKGQAVSTTSTASIVLATAPVITALLARFVNREKLRAYQWFAIGVEFVGVAVLALMQGAFSFNSGLFWLLAASLLLSFYNLLQRRLTKEHTALQTSVFSIFAGTLLLAVFAPSACAELLHAPAEQLFYLGILAVFPSAIAYVSWTKAFSVAKQMSQVSNYMFVTPFLASLMGFLLISEVPDKATLVGGGIILLGLFIFNFGGKFIPEKRR